MTSSIISKQNPFLTNKIEEVCIICRKDLSDQIFASAKDVLPKIIPQIRLLEALKLLTSFAQLNIDLETLRTCMTCFSRAEQALQFQNDCNQSAEYFKAYLEQPKDVKSEAFEIEDNADETIQFSDDNEDNEGNEINNLVCAVYDDVEDEKSDNTQVKDANSHKPLYDRKRRLIKAGEKKECPHCHKMYRGDYLKVHIRTHTGELPYHCKLCEKRFSNPTSLNTHNLVHANKREFLCTFCGSSFRLRTALNIHMRMHTGERPYACEVCGKTFRTSERRKCHMTTHSDEKPFACSQCPKKFSLMKLLKQHKVVHAEIKPIECPFCGRRFTQKHVLRTHQAKSCPGNSLS